MPFALPEAPVFIVTQETLLVAVQVHPAGAVTEREPLKPLALDVTGPIATPLR